MLLPHARTLCDARSALAVLSDGANCIEASSAYEHVLITLDAIHGDGCPAIDTHGLPDRTDELLNPSCCCRFPTITAASILRNAKTTAATLAMRLIGDRTFCSAPQTATCSFLGFLIPRYPNRLRTPRVP